MNLICPICKQAQRETEPLRAYPTAHPLFVSCQIALCQHCGSAWVPNAPSEETLRRFYRGGIFGDSDEAIRYFDPAYILLARCKALARWRFCLPFLNGQPLSLCDIGASYGCSYEVGKHLGFPLEYVGIESSPACRRRITKMGGQTHRDFFDLPLQKKFQLIWASHILEHYPDPDGFLTQLKTWMPPGGIGFVEVPCLDFEFKKDVTQHLLFFSPEGLQKTITRNGLRLLKMDTAGPLRQQLQNLPAPRIKRFIPPWLLKGFRLGNEIYRTFSARSEHPVAQDLSDTEVFNQWELESYGGKRCWIRAAFTLA